MVNRRRGSGEAAGVTEVRSGEEEDVLHLRTEKTQQVGSHISVFLNLEDRKLKFLFCLEPNCLSGIFVLPLELPLLFI